VALTFVAESGKVLIRKFVAWVLAPDVDARADLRLTQIANPLKRAFHSKPDVELSITLGHLLALVWSGTFVGFQVFRDEIGPRAGDIAAACKAGCRDGNAPVPCGA
jgi:hypothetical protein